MEISWNFVSPKKWEPCTSICHSVHKGRGGGMHGSRVCMAGGGMCGGDVHGSGHAWWGGHAWLGGACVAGETATAADGTHPTGMHSC